MEYKRVLTIQDISCVGQCSLTVALPIISACGVETCVLPSTVLSTHTTGFHDFTVRDLTEDMPSIKNHWKKEGIKFDAIYTGYLGSAEQIKYVKDIFAETGVEGCVKVVDPAMADNGKLYPAFDDAFVEVMKTLVSEADFLVPNITEACYLTGMEYRTEHTKEYIEQMVTALTDLGCGAVILTGVSYEEGKTGVVVYQNGEYQYYEHEKLPNGCHGTGDVYASSFVGALMRGKSPYDAARIAADYTVSCIRTTGQLDNHWYGAAFEPVLMELIQAVNA